MSSLGRAGAEQCASARTEMTIDTIEDMYWGKSRLPSEWMTIDEVAAEVSLDPAIVLSLMAGHEVPIRPDHVEFKKHIWRLLTETFGLVLNEDFYYEDEVHKIPVDFHIRRQGICISVDKTMRSCEIGTFHIYGKTILRVGYKDADVVLMGLEDMLVELRCPRRAYVPAGGAPEQLEWEW